jgi:TPR repeat protein
MCEWSFRHLPDDLSDQMLIEMLTTLHLDLERHRKRWREKQEATAEDVHTAASAERKNVTDAELIHRADPVREVIFNWSKILGGSASHDYAEAMKWCRKAAEQGYALAQHDLGRAYQYGEYGVTKDMAEAKRWYRRSAELGCVDALGALIELCPVS